MRAVKQIARVFIYPLITSMGIERLFSVASKNNKLILVYHGVVEQPNAKVSVGPISLKQFTQHLAYFKRNFNLVSLETIFDMYRNDFVPNKKTIALTFDDGYENNYSNAYPLLKQSEIPATIFVVSENIEMEDRITWYDFLDLVKPDLELTKVNFEIIKVSPQRTISNLKDLVKSLDIERRTALFAEIKKQLPNKNYLAQYPREHWRLMNKNELRVLSDSGIIEIGAHTQHHPNLGSIPSEWVYKEVSECKRILSDLLQKEIKSIAFPDGSYTDEVKNICLSVGYENLLAVDYRCSSDKNDKNILPRYCLSSTTTYESNIIQVNRHFRSYGF